MEVVGAQSLPSSLPSFFHGGILKTAKVSYHSIHSGASKRSLHSLQLNYGLGAAQIHKRRYGLAHAYASTSASPKSVALEADASTSIWLLEPIGDGDWKHNGFKVAKPGSYEIVSAS